MSIEKLLIIIFSIISFSKSYILRQYLKSFAESNFIRPNCTNICQKPYDIKVYTDNSLKAKLNECGYTEGSKLFDFALSAIKKQNLYRACHNASPINFSCKMLEKAQNYSQYCSDNNLIETSPYEYNGQFISEVVVKLYGETINGEVPIDYFYKQKKNYNFTDPLNNKGGSVFAQLVWKSTEELGIGLSCKNGYCFLVVDYFPPMGGVNLYPSQVQDLQY